MGTSSKSTFGPVESPKTSSAFSAQANAALSFIEDVLGSQQLPSLLTAEKVGLAQNQRKFRVATQQWPKFNMVKPDICKIITRPASSSNLRWTVLCTNSGDPIRMPKIRFQTSSPRLTTLRGRFHTLVSCVGIGSQPGQQLFCAPRLANQRELSSYTRKHFVFWSQSLTAHRESWIAENEEQWHQQISLFSSLFSSLALTDPVFGPHTTMWVKRPLEWRSPLAEFLPPIDTRRSLIEEAHKWERRPSFFQTCEPFVTSLLWKKVVRINPINRSHCCLWMKFCQ